MAQDPQKPFVSDIVDSGYEQGRQDALKKVRKEIEELMNPYVHEGRYSKQTIEDPNYWSFREAIRAVLALLKEEK